jgi:hypothetical protein
VNRAAICFGALLLLAPAGSAYSVLTHQAIIDSAWDANIKPLLKARFPRASAEDLKAAHSYAYGGCIIQDMGYYPFGSRFFSDLVHYVRSGDFVLNLLHESANLEEYAFALGALAHYAADTEGHPMAVNRSVPMEYPKLARKFGEKVTYADDVPSHLKVEFSFDVLQVARGNYAPEEYHDFIGFHVSKPVLERAFEKTYSLELADVFASVDLALGTYRRTVAGVFPLLTKAAWNLKKDDIAAMRPGIKRRDFLYNLSRASYHREWGEEYEKPGIFARVLAFLFRILPKVGPLRAFSFQAPSPAVDNLFQASFDKTLAVYRTLLAQQAKSALRLANRDLDTGELTEPSEYVLADKAYAALARKLAEGKHAVDGETRANVLSFFGRHSAPLDPKQDPKKWQETLAALETLHAGVPAR